jgi:hypothetical protein
MQDEIYDRGYQAGRDDLHGGIESLARKVRNSISPALSAIHRFEWDAPWNLKSTPRAKA